jgi:long-subunit acyl-CoA synthetase (AMP-forming)
MTTTLGQGFGMSETSTVTHGHLKGQIVSGSVGKLLANIECKIIDVETGKNITKTGTENRGEMCIKGYVLIYDTVYSVGGIVIEVTE